MEQKNIVNAREPQGTIQILASTSREYGELLDIPGYSTVNLLNGVYVLRMCK